MTWVKTGPAGLASRPRADTGGYHGLSPQLPPLAASLRLIHPDAPVPCIYDLAAAAAPNLLQVGRNCARIPAPPGATQLQLARYDALMFAGGGRPWFGALTSRHPSTSKYRERSQQGCAGRRRCGATRCTRSCGRRAPWYTRARTSSGLGEWSGGRGCGSWIGRTYGYAPSQAKGRVLRRRGRQARAYEVPWGIPGGCAAVLSGDRGRGEWQGRHYRDGRLPEYSPTGSILRQYGGVSAPGATARLRRAPDPPPEGR